MNYLKKLNLITSHLFEQRLHNSAVYRMFSQQRRATYSLILQWKCYQKVLNKVSGIIPTHKVLYYDVTVLSGAPVYY